MTAKITAIATHTAHEITACFILRAFGFRLTRRKSMNSIATTNAVKMIQKGSMGVAIVRGRQIFSAEKTVELLLARAEQPDGFQDHVAGDLQTAGAKFVDGVLRRMPVGVVVAVI